MCDAESSWGDLWKGLRRTPLGPLRLAWLQEFFAFETFILRRFNVGTVLDAGSGTGATSIIASVEGSRVVLLDNSLEAIQISRDFYHALGLEAEIIRGDIFNLPFRNNAFDLVQNDGVLEHFDHKRCVEILSEMRRIGQLIMISVPYWWNIGYRLAKMYSRLFGRSWLWGGEVERDYKQEDLVRVFEDAEIKVKFTRKVGRTGGIGSIALLLASHLPARFSKSLRTSYLKEEFNGFNDFLNRMNDASSSLVAKLGRLLSKITSSRDNLLAVGTKKDGKNI
nr:class I SAM-dependent methyltransferase [Candidatus Freyarchaeota archaeon]